MKLSLVFVACAGLFLAACREDSPYVEVITSKTPVVHARRKGAIAVAHGAAIGIQPYMLHPEIEGQTPLPVTTVCTDDVSIVDVLRASRDYDIDNGGSPNGRTFILVGQQPGSTTLRLFRDDDEVGEVLVDVIEQVP